MFIAFRTSLNGDDKQRHIFALAHKELNVSESNLIGEGARATSHRRLPDIPDPTSGNGNVATGFNSVRSSQDTNSELYAQVEIGGAAGPCESHLLTRFSRS